MFRFRLSILAKFRLTEKRSSLGVTDVMPLHAFWEQPFAAALTPACKSRPTAFGAHPGTKAVLSFPCSLGWLISAFHKTANWVLPSRRALTLGAPAGLSMLAGINHEWTSTHTK
jgi:hypothetical protein